MKATFVSALLFGAALAAPAPVNEKRGVVVEEVVVTQWTTTTVYTDAGPTKSAAAFFEFPSGFSSLISSAKATSSSAAPASSAPPPVAAVVSTPPAAPPAAATPAPAPPAPAPAAPASGGGPSGTGDITFYSLGLTSCGQSYSDTDAVVALSHLVMNNGANSNNNPLCGKTITITYNGVTKTGTVVDTCEGCNAGSIDLSPSLFQAFGPLTAGRIPGVQWSVAS